MKKVLLLLALLSLMTSADAVEIDGIYYNLNENEAKVTYLYSYPSGNKNAYKGSVNIPETVVYSDKTYRVTSIGISAFDGCSELTSVTIPSSVTTIGECAFRYCSSLTSVTIPSSVTSIGDNAFESCSSLTSMTIPNSVTTIGFHIFKGCTGELTVNCNIPSASTYPDGTFYDSKFSSVTIGDDVESIGDYAFNCCSTITSVTIGNSVTSIGSSAFAGCSGLTSVVIGNNVTSIVGGAFYGCESLTKVHITDIAAWCNINFESGYSNPLYYAKHLFMYGKEIFDLVIPNTVTAIGNYAFDSCSSLTSIEIPNSVTSIGSSAFNKCSNLTAITIPNSVTSIGGGAFRECSSLTSVTIPNSVTSIGLYAFYECTGDLKSNCNLIYASSSSIGIYYGSKFSSVTIGDDVESIGNNAFDGCTSITSVTIGNRVTSIGNNAFYRCSNITSVTLGKSVTSIGEKAFSYCSKLADVYCYATNVPNTGKDLFYYTSTYSATLHVPEASVDTYKKTSPWNAFRNYDGMDVEPVVEGIAINEENFPDEKFRKWVLNSYGQEGVLTDDEIARADKISMPMEGIKSLKGIEYFTALGTLYFGDNEVTTLDVSKNTELTFLGCSNNQLISLDVSNNTKLTYLSCDRNNLTSLDVSQNTALKTLYIYNNQIKGAEMDALVESLPTVSDGGMYVIYDTNEGNVMTTIQVAAAKAKGWMPKSMVNGRWQDYAGSEPEVKKCAMPVVAFYDGKLIFRCQTEDVEYMYQITTPVMSVHDGNNVTMPTKIQLTVYATKEGYEPSDAVTNEIDLSALIGKLGDVNGDGVVNGTDIQEVINIIVNAE